MNSFLGVYVKQSHRKFNQKGINKIGMHELAECDSYKQHRFLHHSPSHVCETVIFKNDTIAT